MRPRRAAFGEREAFCKFCICRRCPFETESLCPPSGELIYEYAGKAAC